MLLALLSEKGKKGNIVLVYKVFHKNDIQYSQNFTLYKF